MCTQVNRKRRHHETLSEPHRSSGAATDAPRKKRREQSEREVRGVEAREPRVGTPERHRMERRALGDSGGGGGSGGADGSAICWMEEKKREMKGKRRKRERERGGASWERPRA